MGVPKKHHTKSKVGRRRANQRMARANPLLCFNCKAPVLPHRACSNCGAYNKRVSIQAVTPVEEEDE